ncbi:GNAT family N-acetyltransferase [Alteribacillus iranensis]|uniref:N-acetylglutamate synthase n=1 Tax=Alteribacillus iranensis TaxID=930128 RepID=A0A1I2CUR0_9BACI|nr:GNAT family N-acetyltransferase [Alteribacillus iranensis]SFE71460.1 N-acetylglutamate synthase [Alteribacillus iranensis]
MIVIKKATAYDIEDILVLINKYTKKGLLLTQTKSSLLRNLSSTYVALLDGEIVGTASLYRLEDDLAEIRSLAVNGEKSQRGIGKQLVHHLINETKRLQISRVMATTDTTIFFEKCGFHEIPASEVSSKLEKDCFQCKDFSLCHKKFMIMEVSKNKVDKVKQESINIS